MQSPLSSLCSCGCAREHQRAAALCTPSVVVHTPLSICVLQTCLTAAVLKTTTLAQGYEVLQEKKLWKTCKRRPLLELNPEAKLQQLHVQTTLEGDPKAGTTLPALWDSTKVPLDSEGSLLWGCVHSKQNTGSWTSSPAHFKQAIRKRTYTA